MPTLFIDKNILTNNIKITKKLAKDSQIIGVVKENGYGLGLCTYAHLLIKCGIEMLAVTDIEEGITLRKSGIHCDILMLSPLYQKEDIELALTNHIMLCIASNECGELAEQIAKELNLYSRAHICIDTGFGRYGFPDSHVKDIIYTIDHMQHVCITGIYSHFYASACKKPQYTMEQFQRFKELCNTLEENTIFVGFRHIAASCALLKYPETRLDAVRIGSAFLGRIPFYDQWGYKPVGMLEAAISDIHTLPAGHNIGYGHTYITRRKTTVAIVPAGYSHGLDIRRNNSCPKLTHIPQYIFRLIKNTLFPQKIYAHYNEETFPVLGKIGMNSVAIDITNSDLAIGDVVQFPVNPIFVDSKIQRVFR